MPLTKRSKSFSSNSPRSPESDRNINERPIGQFQSPSNELGDIQNANGCTRVKEIGEAPQELRKRSQSLIEDKSIWGESQEMSRDKTLTETQSESLNVQEEQKTRGILSTIRRSISGKEKRERRERRIQDQHELEQLREKVKTLEKQNQDCMDAMMKLQDNLEANAPVGFQFGYGNSQIFVVEQATEVIVEQAETINKLVMTVAELKQTAERNEKRLEEYTGIAINCMEVVNKSNLKPKDKVESLEKLVADIADNQTDSQVLIDGIKALKDESANKLISTDFQSMPARSRRAVRRTVDKYDAAMDCKGFAKALGVAESPSLYGLFLVDGAETSSRLNKDDCAKILIEWSKKTENTPEKYIIVIADIDQSLTKERTKVLKEEFMLKRRTMQTSRSTSQVSVKVNDQETGIIQKEDPIVQYHKDQMAHITKLCELLLNMEKKVDNLPRSFNQLADNVETQHYIVLQILERINDKLPKQDVE